MDASMRRMVRYRFSLERTLSGEGPQACVVMLNPSTADDRKDDRTITTLRALCTNNGYGSFTVCNVFGVRATDPSELKPLFSSGFDLWGGRTMVLRRSVLMREADDIIVAWGNKDISWAGFEPGDTLAQVMEFTDTPLCFGKNKNGTPKHPLYLPYDTKTVSY